MPCDVVGWLAGVPAGEATWKLGGLLPSLSGGGGKPKAATHKCAELNVARRGKQLRAARGREGEGERGRESKEGAEREMATRHTRRREEGEGDRTPAPRTILFTPPSCRLFSSASVIPEALSSTATRARKAAAAASPAARCSTEDHLQATTIRRRFDDVGAAPCTAGEPGMPAADQAPNAHSACHDPSAEPRNGWATTSWPPPPGTRYDSSVGTRRLWRSSRPPRPRVC